MRLAAFAALALLARPAVAEESVKFQPALVIYECPAAFALRSECSVHPQQLPVQQLALGRETLGMKLASWDFRAAAPVPVVARLLVIKTKRPGGSAAYSLACEAGLAGAAPPPAKSHADFREEGPPETLGVATAAAEAGGKKYVVEFTVRDFHGNLPGPAGKTIPPIQ